MSRAADKNRAMIEELMKGGSDGDVDMTDKLTDEIENGDTHSEELDMETYINSLSEKDPEEDEAEEVPSVLRKEDFYFLYNLIQSLKMVIINPCPRNIINNEVFRRWCEISRTYDITGKKGDDSDAVLYFNSLVEGDKAYMDLKSKLDDGENIRVFHYSSATNQKPGQYWKNLRESSHIAVPPTNPNEINIALLNRQVVLENIPESMTEDDIFEKFPEVLTVITVPPKQGPPGMMLVELKSLAATTAFLQIHKGEKINGEALKMTMYSQKLEKLFDKSEETYKLITLTDEERVAKCKLLKKIENAKMEIFNRTDIIGEEKMQEHFRLLNALKPLNSDIRNDTARRLVKNMRIPEKDEFKSAHTKFALSGEWYRKHHSLARKALGLKSYIGETSTNKRSSSGPQDASQTKFKKNFQGRY